MSPIDYDALRLERETALFKERPQWWLDLNREYARERYTGVTELAYDPDITAMRSWSRAKKHSVQVERELERRMNYEIRNLKANRERQAWTALKNFIGW